MVVNLSGLVDLSGVSLSIPSGIFNSGSLHIHGGTGEGFTFLVGGNDASEDNMLKIYLSTPLPFDLGSDTLVTIQSNIYKCQKVVSVADQRVVRTGTPTTRVPDGDYYWNITEGPAIAEAGGIIAAASTAVGVNKDGKLTAPSASYPNFATIKEYTAAAGATIASGTHIPIWIHGK